MACCDAGVYPCVAESWIQRCICGGDEHRDDWFVYQLQFADSDCCHLAESFQERPVQSEEVFKAGGHYCLHVGKCISVPFIMQCKY